MKTSTKIVLLARPRASGVVLPSAISGLRLWAEADTGLFQASDGTTASGNGDPVGYWADQSGQGNHITQATTAAKPTCRTLLGPGGTKPAIEFDGIDDFMQKAFVLTQPTTIFLVAQAITHANLEFLTDGLTNTSMVIGQQNPSPNIFIYSGSFAAANTEMTVGVFKIVSAVFSGAASMLRVNTGTKTTGNPGTTAPNGVTLGGRADGATALANIRVSAMLVYNRDLSASGEDATVLNYLNSKWAVY